MLFHYSRKFIFLIIEDEPLKFTIEDDFHELLDSELNNSVISNSSILSAQSTID